MAKNDLSKTEFSVIIPSFNRKTLLFRAIDSVLSQTFVPKEIWVIDDGSTDGTSFEVRKKYPSVHVVRTENFGVSHARNLGIFLTKAPWVCFLDSDDEWLPNKLELQKNYIDKNPSLRVVHGEEIWIRNGVRVNPHFKHRKSGGDIFYRSLELCLMSPSTVAIHRSVFSDFGKFDENFEVCEDYDLWLRILEHEEVGFVEKPIINKYGGHEDQLSRKYFGMDRFRVEAMERILKETKRDKNKIMKVLDQKLFVLLKGYYKYKNETEFEKLKDKALYWKAQQSMNFVEEILK